MGSGCLRVVGAREHNLQDVALSVPRGKLTVFTGVSGSGKSSLVFDTIFAEGQRKYVESLSSYARQFLRQIRKPDVDSIEGLSPSIAIDQHVAASNPRSIIATTTELYDYLRLLFAHGGQAHCPDSGRPIRQKSTSEIVDEILGLPPGSRAMLLAPVSPEEGETAGDALLRLGRAGFVRARIGGELVEISEADPGALGPDRERPLEAVVDRLVLDPGVRSRLADSTETALEWGDGVVVVLHREGEGDWNEMRLSNRLYSPATGRVFSPMTPRHFSFNLPEGACSRCLGLGRVMEPSVRLLVDPGRSLRQGAILPWEGTRIGASALEDLEAVVGAHGADLDTPFGQLEEPCRQAVLHGNGGAFEGVLPRIRRILEDQDARSLARKHASFLEPAPCPACGGMRLRPEVLAVRLGGGTAKAAPRGPALPGLSIMEVCSLTISQAREFFAGLELGPEKERIVEEPLSEIRKRLEFLERVGLGYLALDRESGTLSGGEAQRIRLASQIGAGLVGVLYILDEPSIGLHPRDNRRLVDTLRRLRDLGNTVLVVEHDESAIRAADWVVDMGPGAGRDGGRVVAEGTPGDIAGAQGSVTGRYLSGRARIERRSERRTPGPGTPWLEVIGAEEHNLRDLDARFPIGCLTCVTGVSGSGKSTLVDGILRRSLEARIGRGRARPGRHREIRGAGSIRKVSAIDQSPIGKTSRSNPATATGAFRLVRKLFAGVPLARSRGYTSRRFSFNVPGGRCEKCRGGGMIAVDMQFLPPVHVACGSCRGRRYNRETLEVEYKGRSIADVLDMTVDQAIRFFSAVPEIRSICRALGEVGLGHLALGQQATLLSGGEAQRVKIAAELARPSDRGQALYLLDEPTTGLHFQDVDQLLRVLFRLRDAGNTLIVIEHHPDVIRLADWVIDLGPEGGGAGGEIVAAGPPEEVARCERSHTGRFLRSQLRAGAAA